MGEDCKERDYLISPPALAIAAAAPLVAKMPDKDEVKVTPNEVLVVKLTPMQTEIERHGVVESPWYLSQCPNFLDAYQTRRVDGKNEFRFRVRQGFDPAMEPIKFVINSNELSIIANYEKQK